jgi:hypothetical protein
MQLVVFVLSLAVFIAILVFNIIFFVWYYKEFYRARIPVEGERIIHKGVPKNVTDENKHKFPQPYDKLFFPFSVKHKPPVIIIFALGMIHWKVTKIFYSRFYMFDMFKAHWEKAKYLRETQDKKWGIVFLAAIDALIIIVGIVGLIIVGFNLNSQLSITLIETIVLTIYLIIL